MPHLQDVGVFQNILGRQRFQIAALALACIVDQYVYATPCLDHIFDERLHASCIGHIYGTCDDGLCGRFQSLAGCRDSLLATGANRNPRAFRCEGLGDRSTDAARGSGHDHALATEINVHRFSL
ncbi:hypothetical protein D3C81_1640530 [compost metagenome]